MRRGRIALDDLDPIVNDVVKSQHGVSNDAPGRGEIDARRRARALVLTVANELGRQVAAQPERCEDPLVPFSQRVAYELRSSFGAKATWLTDGRTSSASESCCTSC